MTETTEIDPALSSESTPEPTLESSPLPRPEFTENAMLVDPETARNTIARERLSPSTAASLLDGCPASWAYSKLIPFDDSPFSPAGAGTLAHQALESFYDLAPGLRDDVTLFSKIGEQVSATFPDNAPLAARLRTQLSNLASGLLALEHPKKISVLETEQKMIQDIDGVPMIGFIDRTDVLDDGTLAVRDYKTGRKKPKKYRVGYERAMRIYALLTEAATGSLPSQATLLYTAEDEASEVDIPLSPRALENTRSEIVEAWEIHNTAVAEASFPTKVSPLCGWCPLVKICDAARTANKTPAPKAIDAGVEFLEPAGHSLGDTPSVSEPTPTKDAEMPAKYSKTTRHAEKSETREESRQAESETPHQLRARQDRAVSEPVIVEDKPYSMLTNHGELNPNSWAANNLFRLYAEVDRVIRTAPFAGEDRDQQLELTKLTFNDVIQTIVDAAVAWTGDADTSPQYGSVTRLSMVAYTHLRHGSASTDFDTQEDVDAWLTELRAELDASVSAVTEAFDALVPAH